MDNDITNWQNLWQEEKAKPINTDELIKNITSLEKKIKLEQIALLITFPITIVVLGILIPQLSNVYFIFGVVFIGLGMLMILVLLYKSRFSFNNDVTKLNNKTYTKTLISKLKRRMLVTSKYMWIYTFLLVLGLNLGYYGVLAKVNFSTISMVIIHLTLSGAMFFIMYFLIQKGKRKNNDEIVPLIELLEELK